MRNVPPILLEALNKQTTTPISFLDLDIGNPLHDSFDSAAEWASDISARVAWQTYFDPNGFFYPTQSIIGDTNIDLTRKAGAVMLAAGTAHVINTTGAIFFPSPSMARSYSVGWMPWQLDVQEQGYVTGNKYIGHTWHHTGYKRTLITQPNVLPFSYTPTSTRLVNDVCIPLWNYESEAVDIMLRILDASGNQVGNISKKRVAFSGNYAKYTFSMLNAPIAKGHTYSFEVSMILPDENTYVYNGGATLNTVSFKASVYVGTIVSTDISWDVPIRDGYWPSGGGNNFASQGSFARIFKMGDIPAATELASFTQLANHPVGTTTTLNAWYTNDKALADASAFDPLLWSSFGVLSAFTPNLPPAQYWRVEAVMYANASLDESPAIEKWEIKYSSSKILTIATQNIVDKDHYMLAHRGLGSMTMLNAKLSARPGKMAKGISSAELEAVPIVESLRELDLKGHHATMSLGVMGIDEKTIVNRARINDLTYEAGKYKLELEDTTSITDRKVPDTKTGAVWNQIIYNPTTNAAADWHLIDIARDLLINRALLPPQFINEASLVRVKAMRPNYTGSRIIDKPTSIFEMLSQLALMLNAQWASDEQNRITLLAEPEVGIVPNHVITDKDIVGTKSVTWRRGWNLMINSLMLLTGYSGTGKGDEQFASGEIFVDAASVSSYGSDFWETMRDWWNIPAAILALIGANYLNAWNDGRAVVTLPVSLRKLDITVGDIVLLSSKQLPKGIHSIKMMVTTADLKQQQQKINLTLLEVK